MQLSSCTEIRSRAILSFMGEGEEDAAASQSATTLNNHVSLSVVSYASTVEALRIISALRPDKAANRRLVLEQGRVFHTQLPLAI